MARRANNSKVVSEANGRAVVNDSPVDCHWAPAGRGPRHSRHPFRDGVANDSRTGHLAAESERSIRCASVMPTEKRNRPVSPEEKVDR